MWWFYALISAFFAALTAVFAKIGVTNVNSNFATAIRTIIILIVAWGIVLLSRAVESIGKRFTKKISTIGPPNTTTDSEREVIYLIFVLSI